MGERPPRRNSKQQDSKKKKKPRSKELKVLSELELSIMNVVWDLDECSSTQVIEEFVKVRSLAPTTIRTVLTNIEKKGYVVRVPSLDRGYRFRAAISRDEVADRSLRRLVSNLFQGSPRLALTHLLKDERLDEDDMKQIRRLLSDSRDAKKKGKRK